MLVALASEKRQTAPQLVGVVERYHGSTCQSDEMRIVVLFAAATVCGRSC